MVNNLLQVPSFATSTVDGLDYALHNEKGYFHDMKKVAYVFLKDIEKLAYIGTDKKVHLIGEDIVRVTSLPVDGNPNVLYIMGDVIYTFKDGKYTPSYENILPEVDKRIKKEIDDLKVEMEKLVVEDVSEQIHEAMELIEI